MYSLSFSLLGATLRPISVSCLIWAPLPEGIGLDQPEAPVRHWMEGGEKIKVISSELRLCIHIGCVWRAVWPSGLGFPPGSQPLAKFWVGLLQSSNPHWTPVTLFSFCTLAVEVVTVSRLFSSDPLLVSGCLTNSSFLVCSLNPASTSTRGGPGLNSSCQPAGANSVPCWGRS